jgi:hypothetical protein
MKNKGFIERKTEILDTLGLTPVRILQSRIHCEVTHCRNKEGEDLVLKIFKLCNRKAQLQKEIAILEQAKPQPPLRFPEIVDFGEDYILTKFEHASQIDFIDITPKHIDLIIKALLNLHQILIKQNGSGAVWNPGVRRLYFWHMCYWLLYLAWEYLSVSEICKCIYLVSTSYKYLNSYAVIGHRAFGMENLLFDKNSTYIVLIDFEHFVLKDNFLYDAVYLISHPHQLLNEWTWQKELMRRYISEIKKNENFTLSDDTIINNLRTTLILVTLHHMGMRRIIDEQGCLFQGMSPTYLISRIFLRIMRLLRLLAPLKLSKEMRIRKQNLEDMLYEGSFKELSKDLIGR